MASLPYIAHGSRILVAGRTGSGKTVLANWLMNRGNQRWIIFNPKHTVGYRKLDDVIAINKFDARKIDRAINNHRFVSLDFTPMESNKEFMDDVLLYLHNSYDDIGICCDELYTLHNNGRQGEGLTALLTRGRERKQSFIGLTQRPAWISKFCFSEADFICSMSLTLAEDRKTMVANSGCDTFYVKLAPHDWLWYTVAADTLDAWGPVPLPMKEE